MEKFLLTRPSRGVTSAKFSDQCVPRFLLTRPSRGVTHVLITAPACVRISTHTPLAGRDYFSRSAIAVFKFLLTRPSRGVTQVTSEGGLWDSFLLTRPSRGVTIATK